MMPTDKTALTWLALALVVATALVLAPFGPSLVLAAWTAIIARPLMEWVSTRLRGRQSAAAALTLLLVVVLLLPLSLLAAGLFSAGKDLVGLVGASDTPLAVVRALVSPAGPTDAALPATVQQVLELIRRHGAGAMALVSNIAGAAAHAVVSVMVYFVATFTFLAEGPALFEWLQRYSPIPPEPARRLASAFSETGRGLILGVGLTAATQAAVAAICYGLFGVPRALLLGVLTGIAGLVPLVGAALVWLPISAGLYLTDQPGKALLLALIGLTAISGLDNFLRPFFYRFGRLDLPVYLLFASVFGGLLLLGPFGAMLGPLVVRLTREALEASRD